MSQALAQAGWWEDVLGPTVERVVPAWDGVPLFVRLDGSWSAATTPLLCLPGLARTGADFDELAARHASRRLVVRPDYRGRGRSGWTSNWRSYGPEGVLRDLLDTLAALGLERVVVVGTSLGGLLGLGLAALRPGLVEALVLNDIGPQVEASGLDPIRRALADTRPASSALEAMARTRAMLPGLGLDEEGWRIAASRTFVARGDVLVPHWDPRLARTLGEGADRDLWPLWRAMRDLPAMLVRGSESPLLSSGTAARMAELHLGLVSWVEQGTGHAPSLDAPGTREAVDRFLDAH